MRRADDCQNERPHRSNGVPSQDLLEVVLVHDDEVPPTRFDVTDRDEAVHGYRVVEGASKEFRVMAAAYRAAADRARRATYPPTARELLERFRDQPREVLLDMVSNAVRPAPFCNDPLLAEVPPQEFVALVLTLPPARQTELLELVHGRHDGNPSERLRPERDWVRRVEKLLTQALPGQRPITWERLRSAIERNLTALHEGDEAEHAV